MHLINDGAHCKIVTVFRARLAPEVQGEYSQWAKYMSEPEEHDDPVFRIHFESRN
jgi:hypothetical protein